MKNYHFISSESYNLNSFNNLESFINFYPDFHTVVLNNDNELKILLELIGIDNVKSKEIKTKNFCRYWDLSNFKFPKFNEKEFDDFYQNWLIKSGRENNMDEYGSLIFLQGLIVKWNKLKYRFIMEESL